MLYTSTHYSDSIDNIDNMGSDGSLKLSRKDILSLQSNSNTGSKEPLNKEHTRSSQSTCQLSNEPLTQPMVSDYRGNLYNKISILEYLVNPESISPQQRVLVQHIKSMKDVVELKGLKSAQGSSSSSSSSGGGGGSRRTSGKDVNDGGRESDESVRFYCGITGDALGQTGGKFGYIVECGDAFATRSLKELGSSVAGGDVNGKSKRSHNEDGGGECPVCDLHFNEEDLIIIGARGDDLKRQEDRMVKLVERGLSHSLKKRKGTSKEGKSKKVKK